MTRKCENLIYPELSYKLLGIAYSVHNKLGGGLREKTYENAMAIALENEKIGYLKQANLPIKYADVKVGDRFVDFLIEDRVVLELKSGERFGRSNLNQVNEYLKTNRLKLAIIINFGLEKVSFKRVINLNQTN